MIVVSREAIVFGYGNALIFQHKYFLFTAKDRLHGPSKIRALEFEGEFQRSAICPVSATVGIDRSISSGLDANDRAAPVEKKDRQRWGKARLDEKPAIRYLRACSCPLAPHISRRPIWDIRKP